MDRESLRREAASRRNDPGVPLQKVVSWDCEFCARSFMTELGFMNHHCREREKIEELKSPVGQAAYSYYAEWMRQQKRSVPDQDRFMSSRQYNFFMKFASWSEKTAIPNPLQFIKVMVETGTQPVLWCRDTTFAMYLDWYDNAYSPIDQFLETYDKLAVFAAEYGVPFEKVYATMGARELAKQVRRRKLSPWFLVVSSKFLEWVQSLPADEREIVSEAVNFGAYAGKLKHQPELARELRAACDDIKV